MTGFRTVLADPPWPENGGGGRGAQNHYPTIPNLDMMYQVIALSPLRQAEHDCFLWMWVTSNYLDWGIPLIQRLGFTYLTDWVWTKKHIGIGQYRRGKHEQLLLAKRGSLPRIGQWPTSTFTEPEGEHSAKPEESYRCVETVTPGPYLELFARNARPGWTAWGNQLSGGG